MTDPQYTTLGRCCDFKKSDEITTDGFRFEASHEKNLRYNSLSNHRQSGSLAKLCLYLSGTNSSLLVARTMFEVIDLSSDIGSQFRTVLLLPGGKALTASPTTKDHIRALKVVWGCGLKTRSRLHANSTGTSGSSTSGVKDLS